MRGPFARATAILGAIVLTGCLPDPEPASPAFWQVDGPNGERAWLLGTIHALERPAQWRGPAIDKAIGEASLIAVEVGDINDVKATERAFNALSRSPGQPPLSQRIDPALRPALAELLTDMALKDGDYGDIETWAAALMLANTTRSNLQATNGVDSAILSEVRDKPVFEFEGAHGQLSLFDRLPEKEQRDLLNAVVRDGGNDGSASPRLAEAWRRGDMAAIEAETRRGLLADPELREVLYTARNRAWSERTIARMRQGARPFVAVGAAHMAGSEGLPALLTARGYRITRLQ